MVEKVGRGAGFKPAPTRLPMIKFHIHAEERLVDRGVNKEEVIATIESGEKFPAKYGRSGFRRNFSFNGTWRGKHYEVKQVEVYAVREDGDWMVITIITRYFNERKEDK